MAADMGRPEWECEDCHECEDQDEQERGGEIQPPPATIVIEVVAVLIRSHTETPMPG